MVELSESTNTESATLKHHSEQAAVALNSETFGDRHPWLNAAMYYTTVNIGAEIAAKRSVEAVKPRIEGEQLQLTNAFESVRASLPVDAGRGIRAGIVSPDFPAKLENLESTTLAESKRAAEFELKATRKLAFGQAATAWLGAAVLDNEMDKHVFSGVPLSTRSTVVDALSPLLLGVIKSPLRSAAYMIGAHLGSRLWDLASSRSTSAPNYSELPLPPSQSTKY